jgi:hypothetical protein
LRNRFCSRLPLPELPSALGRDVDGIIGGEFIKQFVLELDYEARTIGLHDPATFIEVRRAVRSRG